MMTSLSDRIKAIMERMRLVTNTGGPPLGASRVMGRLSRELSALLELQEKETKNAE